MKEEMVTITKEEMVTITKKVLGGRCLKLTKDGYYTNDFFAVPKYYAKLSKAIKYVEEINSVFHELYKGYYNVRLKREPGHKYFEKFKCGDAYAFIDKGIHSRFKLGDTVYTTAKELDEALTQRNGMILDPIYSSKIGVYAMPMRVNI